MIALLVGVIALAPRVAGLQDFFTIDEAYHWIGRVERFAAAVERQDWAATWQTGHPGVTQMWLGTLGLWLEQFAASRGWPSGSTAVEHLAWLRLPSALLQAAAVPLIYLLLRRLVSQTSALIAALLLATSPYLIAYGRLLHLDAPLTAFVSISLLCILRACRARRPLPWMVAAGVAAGLALLTKAPALILLPCAGLLLVARLPARGLVRRFRDSLGWYLLWLATVLLVIFLLWPALWVEPRHALQNYVEEIVANGGRPNGDGQFFLGRAVADPGLLFYPVANLFHLTPIATLGLLALPVAFWRPRHSAAAASAVERRTLLALAAFVVTWTLVMTFGAKKFDRYVLPTWPALLILAAGGLNALLRLLRLELPRGARRRWAHLLARAVVMALLLVELVQPLVSYHPYYLSYYNPLLGGGPAAARSLLIGWGEGLDQVGAYLRSRPDIRSGPVLSALPAALQPFVPVPVKGVAELGQSPANYAVVYLESVQRGDLPAIYARIRETLPLRHVVIHGIRYASIYQLPKPFARSTPAQFGDALRLRGITVERAPGLLTITPSWDVRGRPTGAYVLFLHLLDRQGRRVGQIDVAPGGVDLPPTSAWQPGQQIAVPLPVPADLAAGDYQLIMGLYDPVTGARLPLVAGTPADPSHAGPDALLLDTVAMP